MERFLGGSMKLTILNFVLAGFLESIISRFQALTQIACIGFSLIITMIVLDSLIKEKGCE